MGTKCAPTYATLELGYLKEILYQKVEQIFDLDFKLYFEQNWKRFLDDCFIIFSKKEWVNPKTLVVRHQPSLTDSCFVIDLDGYRHLAFDPLSPVQIKMEAMLVK